MADMQEFQSNPKDIMVDLEVHNKRLITDVEPEGLKAKCKKKKAFFLNIIHSTHNTYSCFICSTGDYIMGINA